PAATLDMTMSVENEYFCIKLAEVMGFQVPKIEILEVEGMKALIIERFDRHWSKDECTLIRLAQEDMCQVFSLPSRLKYQSDGGVG
ncbi:type II toxin-antitoxin system HipA family toxin, partial [Vibrio anguillarum]